MAVTKYSELPVASALTGTELLAVSQDGVSKKVSLDEVRQGIAVSSVQGRSGTVVLDKTDIDLENVDNTSDVNKPVSTAQAAADAVIQTELTAHKASDLDPHPALRLAINTVMQASLTTGLISDVGTNILVALNDTTLRINATTGLYIEGELGAIGQAIKSLPQQDVPLNTAGLSVDGITIRYVGIDKNGSVSFSANRINNDPTRIQLGFVYLSKVGAVTSFINGAAGPLNVITMPIMANVSYSERAFNTLQARAPLSPNNALTLNLGASTVIGECVNWGQPDVNQRTVAALNPAFFLPFTGAGNLSSVPTPTSTVNATQYWNGSTLVTMANANNASVKRVLMTLRGTLIIQYGEVQYTTVEDAHNAILIAPFTEIFPAGYYVEVARIVMRRNATSLQNTDECRIVYFQNGVSGGANIVGIEPGEINTASNRGAGVGIYSQKVGVDLQFKSVVAGDNTTVSDNGTTLQVNTTSDMSGPGVASVDNEIALFNGTTGKVLKRGVVAGDVVSRTVQTSNSDNTAGRVLLTGANGSGGPIPNNNALDANDLPVGERNAWAITESAAAALHLPVLGGTGTNTRHWNIESYGSTTRVYQHAVETLGVSTPKGRKLMRIKQDAVWLDWFEIYTQKTVVGTVSQSGGTPTGAIIETGTNANGTFVKFADGTMICHNGNNVITVDPAVFVGDVVDLGSSRFRMGRWF